jgi:hypothetical protein
MMPLPICESGKIRAAPMMGMIPITDTIIPAINAKMEGMTRSLSFRAIPQACCRKDHPRLRLCMMHSPRLKELNRL